VRRIIVGWKGGGRSRDALRLGALLADTRGADLVIAYAYRYDPPTQAGGVDIRVALRAEALRRLGEAEVALPYAMRARLEPVESRSVVQGLHDLAEAEQADLVVLGSTTRGSLELHALGSIAERLLHSSPCAVAVAPPGFADEHAAGLRVVGVAYDGTPEADNAVAIARDIATRARATMKLIGVVDRQALTPVGVSARYAIPDYAADYRDAVRRQLREAAEALPGELRTEVVLADGDPATEIIGIAGPLSLLVMGSRGYGPIKRGLLGSVSAPVLRAAPCPVLVVTRAGDASAAPSLAEASG
jgi:nucleotide-binding universal stress UspA family protein